MIGGNSSGSGPTGRATRPGASTPSTARPGREVLDQLQREGTLRRAFRSLADHWWNNAERPPARVTADVQRLSPVEHRHARPAHVHAPGPGGDTHAGPMRAAATQRAAAPAAGPSAPQAAPGTLTIGTTALGAATKLVIASPTAPSRPPPVPAGVAALYRKGAEAAARSTGHEQGRANEVKTRKAFTREARADQGVAIDD